MSRQLELFSHLIRGLTPPLAILPFSLLAASF